MRRGRYCSMNMRWRLVSQTENFPWIYTRAHVCNWNVRVIMYSGKHFMNTLRVSERELFEISLAS